MNLRYFLALFTSCVLASCSFTFNQEWNAALKTGSKTGVEGAWQGSWKSEPTGHHGTLKCVVGPPIDTKGTHVFSYYATWAGILSGGYRADHQVTATASGYTFQGEHQMPDWAGGLYTYKGTIKGDEFHADYSCAKDKGTYTLKRVK